MCIRDRSSTNTLESRGKINFLPHGEGITPASIHRAGQIETKGSSTHLRFKSEQLGPQEAVPLASMKAFEDDRQKAGVVAVKAKTSGLAMRKKISGSTKSLAFNEGRGGQIITVNQNNVFNIYVHQTPKNDEMKGLAKSPSNGKVAMTPSLKIFAPSTAKALDSGLMRRHQSQSSLNSNNNKIVSVLSSPFGRQTKRVAVGAITSSEYYPGKHPTSRKASKI
eukprot:TRINITY_DN7822_c0_g1_i1.p1 TRINITY_DN7822_c0_g1~~TRINITY_DN7822_c0_g1_i1.p1  ORF type:complete len:222 (+),score=47.86 TRINITY_DN7822_c0_g1_i1:65-730(+)